ncbi:hypothetical protein Tco_0911969, partial [Tanacetum coccineum]
DLTGDEDPTDEDEDNDMGDPTRGSVSLGGVGGIICLMSRPLIISMILGYKGSRKPDGRAEESIEEDFQGDTISPGRKKSRGSNSGDGGDTGDEGKMGGGVIGACGGGIVKDLEKHIQFVKTSYYCSDKLSAYKFQNKLSAYKFKIQSCRKLFLRKLTFVSEWSFEEFMCEHLSGGIECPDRIRVHAACP